MSGQLGARRADAGAFLPWDESLKAAAVLSGALPASEMTKAAVARECGLSQPRLYQVLTGARRLRRDEAQALARLLGADLGGAP